MEYISKDDAQKLIDMINAQSYEIEYAKTMLGIRERLQSYIDNPDNLQIKMVDAKTAESVTAEPMERLIK